MTKERDEDSGLHDIRSLASSTKLRLSSRRSTQNPVMTEDDVLASSSAGWKAVALPEPAKMVSLPELASLPSKAEVEAIDRDARAKAKAEAKAKKAADKEASAAAAAVTEAAPSASPALEAATSAASLPAIGSRIAAQQTGGRGKLYALVGVGLAAAAGAVLFVALDKKEDTSSSLAYESKPSAPLKQRVATQLPDPAPAAIEAEPVAAAGAAVEEIVEPAPPPPADDKADDEKADRGAKKAKVHKVEIRDTPKQEKDPEPPPPPKKDEGKKPGEEGEPSFDALLKEAGVSEKKVVKPKLDKKSLSGSDIKKGMGSVAGKAQGCYQGTQGTAAVKLTVAPSGQVEKVKVTGVFAGTPVAACVEAAVKSASFPPWDGGPQSFGYSYLLAE